MSCSGEVFFCVVGMGLVWHVCSIQGIMRCWSLEAQATGATTPSS